jgi:replicative DNA helicase
LVKKASARRALVSICSRAIESVQSGTVSPAEAVAHLHEDTDALIAPEDGSSIVPSKIGETIKAWMQTDTSAVGRIPTPIPKLNTCLGGGLANGRLYYLGARPSVGKTSLALDIARHAAKAGHGVLVVSLEMPEVDGITTRAVSQESLVSELTLRSGLLSDSDYPKMVAGCGRLSGAPLWITDRAYTIQAITHCATRWPFTPRLSLLIVDYLQLIRGEKSESRRVEIEGISRALKLLAGTIHAPVLCISALRRRESDDQSPTMSDLKETGELEYDGDAIFLLHRGFNAENAELIIAKNKYGPVGTVPLLFKKSCVTFEQAPEA